MFLKSLTLAALAIAITVGPGAAATPFPRDGYAPTAATTPARSDAPALAQRYPPGPRSLCAKAPYETCGSTEA
ncbi:MAG: hypothetical protein AB7K35_05475 [Pseudorhodoplanes sp.]